MSQSQGSSPENRSLLFVADENIKHFNKILDTEKNENKRELIKKLIVDEEEKKRKV
jgi:hypothetical protein